MPEYSAPQFAQDVNEVDRATKPLFDVVDLYQSLDQNRNGLSKREVNEAIQDPNFADHYRIGLHDDRAIGLSVLKKHYEEFRGLSDDGSSSISKADINAFKQVPHLAAMSMIASNRHFDRYLDANDDGQISKNEVGNLQERLQKEMPESTANEAVKAMLADFEIISQDKDHIETKNLSDAVSDYSKSKLSADAAKLSKQAQDTIKEGREKLETPASDTVFDSDDPNAFQVLQSNLGDCYALAPLASTIARNPEALKKIFGHDEWGYSKMHVSLDAGKYTKDVRIAQAAPTAAEIATYAGARADGLSINTAEKLLGALAEFYPEEWSKIIGVTNDQIVNSTDAVPFHEYLEGGGNCTGLLSLLNGQKYKERSIKSLESEGKLEESLKRLGRNQPAVVSLESGWLTDGISSSTSTSTLTRDQSPHSPDKDRESKEKDRKSKEEDRKSKDYLPEEASIFNNRQKFGLPNIPMGIGEPDWDNENKRGKRSLSGDYHAVALIDYNADTKMLTLYNSWGSGEGARMAADGRDDGHFQISLEQLKKLKGAICLPESVLSPSSVTKDKQRSL